MIANAALHDPDLFRRVFLALSVALSTGLGACGSAGNDTHADADPPLNAASGQSVPIGEPSIATLSITLTTRHDGREKTGRIGQNILDISPAWPSWTGGAEGVTYDDTTGLMQLPAPGGGRDLTVGVQCFDHALSAGSSYSLNIASVDNSVAAIIFLFGANGQFLPISVSAGALSVARPGEPFVFDAPAGTAGFYLQVQSGWRVTSDATAGLSLVQRGVAVGDNLIDPNGAWIDWDNTVVNVSYNALINQVFIGAPGAGDGNTKGIRRFSTPLTGGAQYELSVDFATEPGQALLLFLVNQQGQIVPFTDPATDETSPWLAATADPSVPADNGAGGSGFGGVRQFVAPEGIVGFVVQVQSRWQASNSTFIIPALRLVN